MASTPQAGSQDITDRIERLRRSAADNPLLVLIGLLLALMVTTNIVSPGFLLPGNFSTTLLIAGPMGMLTAGQTVVILTGGIDLSTTATATIAAYCLVQYGGAHPLLAVLGALGIGIVRFHGLARETNRLGIFAEKLHDADGLSVGAFQAAHALRLILVVRQYLSEFSTLDFRRERPKAFC